MDETKVQEMIDTAIKTALAGLSESIAATVAEAIEKSQKGVGGEGGGDDKLPVTPPAPVPVPPVPPADDEDDEDDKDGIQKAVEAAVAKGLAAHGIKPASKGLTGDEGGAPASSERDPFGRRIKTKGSR